MAFYDLLKDFNAVRGTYSVSPGWVLAVVRFKNQVTYNREYIRKRKPRSGSYSNLHPDSTAERGPIIISGDCINLSTQSQKGQHTSSLQAALLPGMDYVVEILPGDWVCAWMVNQEEDRKNIIRRLKRGQAVNDFMDGLKFIGRVSGVRKTVSVQPTGIKAVGYTVSARGFAEFDSPILYFPQLEQKETEAQSWLHKLGKFFNQITRGGEIDINKIMPELVKTLLGEGIKRQRGLQRSPNQGLPFLIPSSIATFLGRNSGKSTVSYADILEGIIGIQHYQNNNSNDYRVFLPNVKDENAGPLYQTDEKMLGRFLPYPPSLDNRPIWNVLGDYLNPAVNEMFVTLRANREGKIVPHFIVRQMPFTTPANKAGHIGTLYHELPRWKLDDVLVINVDVGTNEAARFNFVQVMGLAQNSNIDAAKAFQINPPIWDDEDIKRSGLRPYSMVVNCARSESIYGVGSWTAHVADFLMGQQLAYTGQFQTCGIQAPICIGDNLEYDGVVYHIEGVQHRGSISPEGIRQFWTTLQVTHGLSSETTMAKSTLRTDQAQYPALVAGTTGFEPGLTIVEEKV
jgi:hypothetical protein